LAVTTNQIANNAVTRSAYSPGLVIFTRYYDSEIRVQTVTLTNCIAGSYIKVQVLFNRTQTSGDMMELYAHQNGANTLLFTYAASFAGTNTYQNTPFTTFTATAGTNTVGFGFKGKTTNIDPINILRYGLEATEFIK
jgi:hypothetical protein